MRKAQFSALISVLTCVLLTSAWPQSSGSTGTQVIRYEPSGTLPDSGRNGYCWTSSIAAPFRPDAWRCTEGNVIHDPCFSLADQEQVVCGVNPVVKKSGFVLRLTKPLPQSNVSSNPASQNWAWMIELSDGTVCTPFTGTRPFISGETGFYGCNSINSAKQFLLMGDLDSSKAVWTARRATLVKAGNQWVIQSSQTVSVKVVWQ